MSMTPLGEKRCLFGVDGVCFFYVVAWWRWDGFFAEACFFVV